MRWTCSLGRGITAEFKFVCVNFMSFRIGLFLAIGIVLFSLFCFIVIRSLSRYFLQFTFLLFPLSLWFALGESVSQSPREVSKKSHMWGLPSRNRHPGTEDVLLEIGENPFLLEPFRSGFELNIRLAI